MSRSASWNAISTSAAGQILGEIDSLVSAKADLDYQHAMQLTLKSWLFLHLPLNYGLMLFTLVHIVIVYAFASGAP